MTPIIVTDFPGQACVLTQVQKSVGLELVVHKLMVKIKRKMGTGIENPPQRSFLSGLTLHDYSVWSVAFSPTNPNLIISGSDDKTIKLWNVLIGTYKNLSQMNGHSSVYFPCLFPIFPSCFPTFFF